MRKIRWVGIVLIIFLVVVVIGNVWAEEKEKKHPIDVWLEKCIEKDSSTAGMIKCSGKAYEMWDKEMNKVYQELMKKLSPEEKELLKESQKQWLKFRDSEFRFLDKFFEGYGTILPVLKAGEKISIIKERTKRLDSYLFYINEAIDKGR